jgi:histidinol-phosphate phosphatase family protein
MHDSPQSSQKQPALFLDRDGVIIENRRNYVRSWQDVEIYPQALSALSRIANAPYKIVIVTNQSAVGRGIITLDAAWDINNRLVKVIEKSGGRINGVYLCPHAPGDGCNCRKPKPGLLLQAAQEHNVDLSKSILIGDALTDLLAGQSSGVRNLALVRTGRGASQAQYPEREELAPFPVFEDLTEALLHFFPPSS